MGSRISLILTTLNEEASIDALLQSIVDQDRLPDEIVVVDGGSTDRTWEKLCEWQTRLPLRLERCVGATIAQGRNAAIRLATGELIAVTDAGVRLDPSWLAALASAAERADVVSGFFRSDPATAFEWAMGATVLPALEDVNPSTVLPSCRSVLFHRDAWERVGGYPEWLVYCEDLVFDLSLY